MTSTSWTGAQGLPLAAHYYPALAPSAAEPLVLLHGWGCGSDTWGPLLPGLRQHSDVMTLDLPGFGRSPAQGRFELEAVLELLAQCLPQRATLMGWSLGGMLAVALAARCPERVVGLITLASNARFVATSAWPEAMAPSVNQQFSAGFAQNAAIGLRRFAALMARGDQSERELLKRFRAAQPPLERVNPLWGQALELLSSLDNTAALQKLRQPGLHIYGEHDALVPDSTASALAALNPRQQVSVLAGAGHALHWSQPERVVDLVKKFLRQTSGQLDKRRVARSFSQAASSYDGVARLQRAVGEELMSHLDERPLAASERVLDLGCGTGYFTERLARRLAPEQLLGLDIAEGMLRFARQAKGSQALWLCADAEALPLANASIDLVFSSLSVQWCEHLPTLFAELCRVLKPGGQVLFSTLGPRTLWELKSAWQAVDGYVHVNRFQPQEELKAALTSAGLVAAQWTRQERVLYYEKLSDLTRELKALGAHNVNRGQPEGLTGRGKIQALKAAYEPYRQEGVLPASYEVYYGRARKP